MSTVPTVIVSTVSTMVVTSVIVPTVTTVIIAAMITSVAIAAMRVTITVLSPVGALLIVVSAAFAEAVSSCIDVLERIRVSL